MRIVVNKLGLVYLDFGLAGRISLQLYLTYHRLLHLRVAVNSHALPVHKKNRITSLLCIFETIILPLFVYACMKRFGLHKRLLDVQFSF